MRGMYFVPSKIHESNSCPNDSTIFRLNGTRDAPKVEIFAAIIKKGEETQIT